MLQNRATIARRSLGSFYIWFQIAILSSEQHNFPSTYGSPTSEVYNPDKFPQIRTRGDLSVDQLRLIDRSTRKTVIDRSVSRTSSTFYMDVKYSLLRAFLVLDFWQRLQNLRLPSLCRDSLISLTSPSDTLLEDGSHVSCVIHKRLFAKRRWCSWTTYIALNFI